MSEHEFLKHLKEDHEKQKDLGKQLGETSDPRKRDQLRSRFHESLYPHIVGEEASIFKRLKQEDDEEIRDDALEGLQEHHVAKIVLRELMKLSTDSDTFKAKSRILDELNRHHIEEEEGNIFHHLRRRCEEQELDNLFRQYKKAEEEAKS